MQSAVQRACSPREKQHDARSEAAQAGATGLPDLAGLPNTAAGLAQAVVKLRDANAPNVLVGYHLRIWGTGTDLLHTKPDDATVVALAQQSAAFEQSLGACIDLTAAEFLDRDSAFYQYQYGDPNAWYAPADYARQVLYLGTYGEAAGQTTSVHTIKLGIFSPGWGTLESWNDNAGQFTVAAS